MRLDENLLATFPPKIQEELSYRIPMRITEKHSFLSKYRDATVVYHDFAVCPRCKGSFEVDYQAFCGYCGQKLDWKGYGKIKPEMWEKGKWCDKK